MLTQERIKGGPAERTFDVTNLKKNTDLNRFCICFHLWWWLNSPSKPGLSLMYPQLVIDGTHVCTDGVQRFPSPLETHRLQRNAVALKEKRARSGTEKKSLFPGNANIYIYILTLHVARHWKTLICSVEESYFEKCFTILRYSLKSN